MSLAEFPVRSQFVPFAPPLIGEEEIAEVVETLRGDWLTTGPRTRQFQAEFADTFAAPAATAVSSCTAGLHLALAALGVGPGDEVVTTTLTFCSTANVVEHVGARPVLVDVEPDTLNIDPAAVERALSPRTKAIVPVHYCGHAVDLDAIQAIADQHGVAVIEDAAHAVHAKYKGRWIGSSPNLAAFSFYPTKNMTTGEGGMVTGAPDLVERVALLSSHGMSRDAWKRFDRAGSWRYDVVAPGFKYNMTDIQAALGLRQLDRLGAMQARRRQLVARYDAGFKGNDQVQTPTERPEVESSWHMYVLRINLETLTIDRDRFFDEVKARNVGLSVHYIPVHTHPYYADKYGYRPGDIPVANENFERMVTLPLSPKHTDDEIDYVVEAVTDVLRQSRR